MNLQKSLKDAYRRTKVHHLYRRVVEWATNGLPAGPDRNAFYDLQTIQVMQRILRKDSNCVDVGAHAGAILQHIVALAPFGAHDAFERLPHLAAGLRVRFPSVRVHEAALRSSSTS